MCGRYANHVKNISNWVDILGDWPGGFAMSMDISPGQTIPVVVGEGENPVCRGMRWGLVPAWSDTPRPKYATYNARLESVAHKPAFRGAYAHAQSCLVPASAYYEWKPENGRKIKYRIRLAEEMPLFMAGLWEYWTQGEQQLYSCTILTRPAVAPIEDIHPRMPLILNRDEALGWLMRPREQLFNDPEDYIRRRRHYPLLAEKPD